MWFGIGLDSICIQHCSEEPYVIFDSRPGKLPTHSDSDPAAVWSRLQERPSLASRLSTHSHWRRNTSRPPGSSNSTKARSVSPPAITARTGAVTNAKATHLSSLGNTPEAD
jgi:hypothetical protein